MNPQSQVDFTTAQWPGQSNRDQALRLRGQEIARTSRIVATRIGYRVPSQSGNGSYIVNLDGSPFCTCQDFEKHQQPCKHIYAVNFMVQQEDQDDGSDVETQSYRVSYGQNWKAYNAAQVNEQEMFTKLLRELCDTVPQPEQKMGRPRLPLSDMLFTLATKVYSTMSGRRAMTDVRNAQANGQLDKTPSFTSLFRYLEKAELTPLLKSLIEQSALPLKDVEVYFAPDSSGFSTSVYDRWFDQKWGKPRRRAQFVKAHIICGVQTNVVTTAEVTPGESSDAIQLPAFLNTTAQNFSIHEVSADKAYLSKRNLRAVEAVGGVAFIPFKVNSTAHQGHHKRDSLWEKMYHYFHLQREEFLAHYHKRSNVETTFSMIKAKFGGSVRSKTATAQVNEVLTKILCHNIVVLIQAMFELGITPVFLAQTRPEQTELLEQNEQLFPKSSNCSQSQRELGL